MLGALPRYIALHDDISIGKYGDGVDIIIGKVGRSTRVELQFSVAIEAEGGVDRSVGVQAEEQDFSAGGVGENVSLTGDENFLIGLDGDPRAR